MLFCYVLERLRFPAFVAAQFIPQAFRKEKPPGEIFFCQELPGGFFQRRLFPAVGVQGFPEWHKPQAAPFPSGSCSNSARKVPRGRVMSHRTFASVFPRRLKRICSSSPIRTRSFFFCLSSEMTNKIVFVIFVCLNTRSNNII